VYFVAKYFITPYDTFMEKILDAGFRILDFKRKLSLFYPASSIQYQLVE